MSAESYSQFWCLDNSGWTRIDETQTPEGWVRIYEERVYQGSPFGKTSRVWSLLRTNAGWTDQDADALERRFPRPEPARTLSLESLNSLGAK